MSGVLFGFSFDDIPPVSAALTPTERARRGATAAMLGRNHGLAIDQLSRAISLEVEGSRGHLEALRLRCTALLRARRHPEALLDASAAVAMLPSDNEETAGAGPSSRPSAQMQSKVWHLHGIALAKCGHMDDAVVSYAKALKVVALDQLRRRAAQDGDEEAAPTNDTEGRVLLESFLEAAAAASTSSLPIEVYAGAAEARVGMAPSTPAFQVQMRPRFSPWPLAMHAPLAPHGGAADGAKLASAISVFCATSGMPAEPHLCTTHHDAEREALVCCAENT
jgi:hypothetical protein